MTTITVLPADQGGIRPESGARRLADWLATAIHRLQWAGGARREASPVGSRAAAELIARAEAYEATQPSFAADLRAAAAQLCC
jgi:hypothetical protein